MDIEAAAFFIVTGLTAIYRQKGEHGNELETLAHHIGEMDIVRPLIIGRHIEDAPGQGVHHVPAGSLQDHVPDKVVRKGAVIAQQLLELG